MFKKRLLLVLSLLLIVSAIALPMAVSAGSYSVRFGFMWVPRQMQAPKTLTVDGISVTVMPDSIPNGGPVILRVIRGPDGWFMADFWPDREFEIPVVMDFGGVYELNYHAGSSLLPIVPRSPELVWARFFSEHFSRYSGWH